jgi:hypothetical protein
VYTAQNQAEVTIVTSDKLNFKSKSVKRDKGLYTMIKKPNKVNNMNNSINLQNAGGSKQTS